MSTPELRDGSSWTFDAFVVGCVFDGDGTCAFALGDGSLRLVDSQGTVKEVTPHNGACLSLVAHPKSGFVTGGDDGRLVHTSDEGASVELAKTRGKWIEQVAVAPDTGLIAYAAGKEAVILHGDERASFAHGTTVAGLAFDPKGRRLAAAHYDGVSLWWAKASNQGAKVMKWKGSHLGVTWSPDGRFLVSTMQENALHGWRMEDAADMRMTGYPAKVKSWAWDRRGKFMFTSGAPRVIGWPFAGRSGPMDKEPREIGPQRDALITVVAASPRRDAIAAGMSDGTVWIEHLDDPGTEYVALKGEAISALAFSPDGKALALASESGFAALIPVG
ncbi:MAG: WD40 repeat domain-containing protein [Alphaproteobacteria bacterium]|nr:WD40 repeat domain-containing protein [Alphaproteobacteria bacterium]